MSHLAPRTPPESAARQAGLRYVDDRRPGSGGSVRARGSATSAPTASRSATRPTLRRIKARWRSRRPGPTSGSAPTADGHLQATGRDARGRKQYRYHPRWRAVRDETKYGRMMAFGRGPAARSASGSSADLARPGLPREKVLATVVRLLETTLIRVGNEEYARTNHSFGLTTMRDRHVEVGGAAVRFEFRGKSGVKHAIDLADRRLARIVGSCRDLPGQELFQYLDDDGQRPRRSTRPT